MKIFRNITIVILFSAFLFTALQKALAINKSIFVSGSNTQVDTNVRYDITISDADIAAASQIDPSCPIIIWTLNTGYGKTDDEAINFYSQGNTNNVEKPITQHQYVFSEQNGYDVLHSNGFDRVMPVISFYGENESCEIKYPISAKPILFSEFPYSYPGTTTPTP